MSRMPRADDADEAPFAQKTMKHLPTQGRSATAWIAAAMLAMTWASETQSSPDHARHLADAQHAMAARNLDSAGIAGYGDLPPGRSSNDKSVQVAQATTGDAGHPPEREHHWAETQSLELTIARRDIELLQRLVQEHDRAEQLEQALAAARRDVETQTALAGKASEQASRLKQVGESGTAEVQTSLQQERERSARLEQDLVAARRDVETQTALATQRQARKRPALKQASESSGAAELQKSLQQERERSARLEQDLAAARRDVETQTALAAKAGEEASRLKQASESSEAELQKSLQQERERSARLEQDLAAARRDVETQTALAAKASEEASRLKQASESSEAALQKSLQQERERSVRLEQDLAAARRDVETQTALATKAGEEASRLKQASESSEAELQKSLQQERERSARLEQDLAAARRDVETQTALATKAGEEASRLKQASESSEAELQKSLQQERERSARLEQDLAAARRDVETQTALAAKAGEEASRLKQASESSEAELQKSLQQERERSARLEQDLAAARRDVETQTALAAKASEEASRLKQASESSEAELQKSLQQERERSARLEQDLAAARRDVETQTALAAKATEEVPRAKRAAEADAAELRQSMQKERERADALAQGLSMTRSALYAYEARARKLEDEAAELRTGGRKRCAVASQIRTGRARPDDAAGTGSRDRTSRSRYAGCLGGQSERGGRADEADGGARLSLVAQLAAAGAGSGRTARAGSRTCETGCTQCRDGWLDRAGQAYGKREVSRRRVTGGGRSERCPAQFQESRGGGSVACACERAARAGRHRRGADCAGARRRDGQRPGKLLARRNL